jgi:hypothetical protein
MRVGEREVRAQDGDDDEIAGTESFFTFAWIPDMQSQVSNQKAILQTQACKVKCNLHDLPVAQTNIEMKLSYNCFPSFYYHKLGVAKFWANRWL